MDTLFERAVAASREHDVKNVLVALGSGRTALAARKAFPSDYRVFAVGNRAGVVKLDDRENEGVSDGLIRQLESADVIPIVAPASLFQHIARGTQKLEIGSRQFDFRKTWGSFPSFPEVLETYTENRNLNPISLLLSFCDWFGAGFQVALEIMLLAADSGQIPDGEKVISVVRPYEPRPLCYAVFRPCRTEDLPRHGPEILAMELIPSDSKSNRVAPTDP